jgi:hypothetical protein
MDRRILAGWQGDIVSLLCGHFYFMIPQLSLALNLFLTNILCSRYDLRDHTSVQ